NMWRPVAMKQCIKICLFSYIVLIFPPALPAKATIECYQCHGTSNPVDYRPLDTFAAPYRNPSSGGFRGNHRTHMSQSADKSTCAKCHPGSDGYTSSHAHDSGNMIKVSPLINNSPNETHYPSPNKTAAFPQTSDKSNTGRAPLGSCYNVNCHFENPTPTWGDNPVNTACNTCHGAPPN